MAGHNVRAFVVADLKALTKAARAAGRVLRPSAFRSYSTTEVEVRLWFAVSGYRPPRSRRAPGTGTASIARGPP